MAMYQPAGPWLKFPPENQKPLQSVVVFPGMRTHWPLYGLSFDHTFETPTDQAMTAAMTKIVENKEAMDLIMEE